MKIIEFIQSSIAGEISLEEQEKFLLQDFEISATELADVVKFLRTQIPVELSLPGAIDLCGTGGSDLERINTSTISSILLASQFGIGVAKHGNKASSGRFGSFDLLEGMGRNFYSDPTQIEQEYEDTNLALIYAKYFHPCMRHFAEVRKKIGRPTFFNILGPLLNPADTKRQIIGTAFQDKMMLIAETCNLLEKERVFVVSAENCLDEVTLTGETKVIELNNGEIREYNISPNDFGVELASFNEIRGGDAQFNTNIAHAIINGECQSRHLDLVLVNMALALVLSGKTEDLKAAYKMAKEAVLTPSILREIVIHKRMEVAKRKAKNPNLTTELSQRDFKSAISRKELSLIAEIKSKSPSEDKIAKTQFKPREIAMKYEKSLASAISVLCDEKYFGGSLEHLQSVAESTYSTPLLCKDFIIDEYQIYEARAYGADAILLIAAILSEEKIQEFLEIASSLKMHCICEVHNEPELEKVLKTDAEIIGINNRNLHNFELNIENSLKLLEKIPEGKVLVSESGFHSYSDVAKVKEKFDAILVGTAIMKGTEIREFQVPALKICGIRDVATAKFCDKLGVSFLGLNFVPRSKRKISLSEGKIIRSEVHYSQVVGVFENQDIEEVNGFAEELNLDFIQLCGEEDIHFIRSCSRPVIKTIRIKERADLKKIDVFYPHVAHLILDSSLPGAGEKISLDLSNVDKPFILAGGINLDNCMELLSHHKPMGLDIASGIETNGEIDLQKIKEVFEKITN